MVGHWSICEIFDRKQNLKGPKISFVVVLFLLLLFLASNHEKKNVTKVTKNISKQKS